jgi:hypothetical protein
MVPVLGIVLVLTTVAACSEIRPIQSAAEIPHHDPK